MSQLIVILEDDQDRIDRLTSIIKTICSCEIAIWRTAPDFIKGYTSLTQAPSIISLDHDLFADSFNDPDPGDGRDVAKFLAGIAPICPIILHSSNSAAVESMKLTLHDSSWKTVRVPPIGDDWIESIWAETFAELLQKN